MGRAFLASVIASAAALGLAASASAASGPLRLGPASQWTVVERGQSCRLVRTFGSGDQETLLFIQRFEPGDPFKLGVGGKPVRKFGNHSAIEVQFGPGESRHEVTAGPANLGAFSPAIILPSASIAADQARATQSGAQADPRYAVSASREAAIEWLGLGRSGKQPLVLETGPMDRAFASLRACSDDLLSKWGVDPAADATLASRPRPTSNPGGWLDWRDYPDDWLESWQEGVLRFIILVDAQGAPTGCRAQEWTGSPAAEQAICAQLIGRARFDPARDAQGNAVPSYWRNSVRFIHPYR